MVALIVHQDAFNVLELFLVGFQKFLRIDAELFEPVKALLGKAFVHLRRQVIPLSGFRLYHVP